MDRIKNLLLAFLKDQKLSDYDGVGKEELIYNYKMQLFIISCKSLQYMDRGVTIDYNRFREEMNLLKYYVNGTNKSLEATFNKKVEDIEDDSILYRVLPIAVSNQDNELIEKEVFKNAVQTTINSKSILFGLIYAFAVSNYIEYGIIDKQKVKEYIIRFSIKDYSSKYEFLDKSCILKFEKDRIELIGKIDNILNNIIEVLSKYKTNEDIPGKDNYLKLIDDFSQFLKNVRKGNVNLESKSFKNENKKIKVFEGNIFDHYLLGKSMVVKNEKLYFYVKTKYGLFKFKKL